MFSRILSNYALSTSESQTEREQTQRFDAQPLKNAESDEDATTQQQPSSYANSMPKFIPSRIKAGTTAWNQSTNGQIVTD
jgi:hypothetical protein